MADEPTRQELIDGVTQWMDRFWKKVQKTDDHWLWTAALDRYGYGVFAVRHNKATGAHRLAYELAHGPVPPGHRVDHHFRCPKNCVNPDHLRAVTPKQDVENHAGPRRDSASGVRGVNWSKQARKWHVQVQSGHKRHHGGYFSDLADAEAAAVALRNKLFTHNDLDRV